MLNSFDKISDSQWLEQIKQSFEKAGRSISDIYTSWDEKIQVAPFYTKSPEVFVPIKNILPENQWYRWVEIIIKNSCLEDIRDEVLSYLEAGANAFYFCIQDENIDLASLLRSISFSSCALYFSGRVTHYLVNQLEYLRFPKDVSVFLDVYKSPQLDNTSDIFAARKSVSVGSRQSNYSLASSLADALYQANQSFGLGSDEYTYFKLNISSDFFSEIVRLRALRVLWEFIKDSYDIPKIQFSKIHIQAVMLCDDQKDQFGRMIQTSSEVLSAVIGGADSLTVPLGSSMKENTAIQKYNMLGLHQQTLLKEESYLEDVIDPSRGSYYLDTLTDKLCRSAYELFQSKFE